MIIIHTLHKREPEKISRIFDIHEKYCAETGNGELTIGLKEDLADPKSIVIVATNDKEEICGYLLAIEHNHACELFYDFDTNMEEDPAKFYVDLLEIVAEIKNPRIPVGMLLDLAEESRKRGIYNFSMHIRDHLVEKFIYLIRKKITPDVRIVRIVKGNWYGKEEKYAYIEASIKDC